MWVELLRKQMSLKKKQQKNQASLRVDGCICAVGNEPLQVHGFTGSGMEKKPEINLSYPLHGPSPPMPIQVCVCPVHQVSFYFQIALRPDSADSYLAINLIVFLTNQ